MTYEGGNTVAWYQFDTYAAARDHVEAVGSNGSIESFNASGESVNVWFYIDGEWINNSSIGHNYV